MKLSIKLPLLIVSIIFAATGIVLASVDVFFGPKPADAADGVYSNLLRFIDSSQHSIYGSVHEIDMIAVAEKLAAKAAAGVDVRLVVESRWWESEKDTASRQILQKSKVKVIPDTKKSGLMHNKFFVSDEKRVWTGSTNLTMTCLLYNPNCAVWVENPLVVENYLNEFRKEEAGHFGKRALGKSDTPNPAVSDDTSVIETCFCPEDNPLSKIVQFIDSAKESIDIACFVFSSKEILDAVLRAHQRGVHVRVLLDNTFAPETATARWKCVPFKELAKAGVDCSYDNVKSKLHHKTMIIDKVKVMAGSMNLSTNGAKNNNENFLIIESKSLGKSFEDEFERLWDLYHKKQTAENKLEDEDDEL